MTLELLEAICALHRRKDAAYGGAWKKRGEVFGIMPNIARKVDRLETIGVWKAEAADGETFLDTAVDLLVYCTKYKAFLADQDRDLADLLFKNARVPSPFSDGPIGVEFLLRSLPIGRVPDGASRSEASAVVVSCFAELERCFVGAQQAVSPNRRLRILVDLTLAATDLLEIVGREEAAAVQHFILTNRSAL